MRGNVRYIICVCKKWGKNYRSISTAFRALFWLLVVVGDIDDNINFVISNKNKDVWVKITFFQKVMIFCELCELHELSKDSDKTLTH